ncbi:MAG TPA: hypothetical protein VME66_13840 [Candidatus Acidoferrales bacterium]|nr:hypothetical protein [Candidatus Acidoferrales bacterium]
MARRYAILALAFLTACSGGTHSSASGSPPLAPAYAGPLATTSFTFVLPAKTSSSTQAVSATRGTASATRHPAYLTTNVQSVTIALNTVNGAAPPAGLTTSVTSNINLAGCPCTISGPAVPPGTDAFSVATYDASNAGGNEISEATTSATIVSGTANSVPVVLDGIPASLSISALPSGAAGTPFGTPQSFTLAVKDADGNTITGTYATPVTLTDSDTSSVTLGTALTVNGGSPASSVVSTSSSDTIALSYGGLAIAPATIGASATGATGATATFTPTLSPIVYSPGSGANASGEEIDLYAASGTGSSGAFSVSEVGYSNAPYNKTFTASLGSGCSTIATAAPPTGTAFTATVVGSPSVGTCTLSVADGGLHTPLSVTLTYTTSSIGAN